MLFFDASDDVLVRRFSETRRPHPLGGDGGPLAGIQRERAELVELRERADRIIDTSALTVHQLRDELQRLYRAPSAADSLTVLLVSFGYKFGVPTDVDMVLDARFLANPFFVDELRAKTGCDPAVAAFVLERPRRRSSCASPRRCSTTRCRSTGARAAATSLAIGCTGGRHRSVALVERLGQDLAPARLPGAGAARDMRR